MRLGPFILSTAMLITSTAAAQQPDQPAAPGSYDAALRTAPAPAGDYESDDENWSVGLKAGALMGGSVYVERFDESFDSNPGALFLVTLDAVVGRRISLGAFLLHARPSVTVLDTDYDTPITTVGATIKGRFGPSGGVSIRPGIALGYQRMTIEGQDTDEVKGLDLGAMLEVSIPAGGVRIPFEVGIISQPVGGNDDSEVTFAPIPYLAGGVEFGG